jgi:hypothetical protein
VSEVVIPGRENLGGARIRARSLRRRRRLDLRMVATGVALFVVVAWTIIFGVGVALR